MTGKVGSGGQAGSLQLDMEWGDPVKGSGTDLFTMSPDGRMLTVSSVISIGGQQAAYKTVYSKK